MNSPSRPSPSTANASVVLALVALTLWCIILTAPPNLEQNNELRVAAYVQDAVENGHWLCQRDAFGGIASKPPFYTWLSALATLVSGRISGVTLYFPSVVATFALAGTLFGVGRERFGARAGFLGALVYLLSHVAEKQLATARYDALFALTVMLAAVAAFRAWTLGRGWVWFWLAAAAATLTKGPLGLVLGGAGLLAALWERWRGTPAPLRGSHVSGVALFLFITAGWLALAYWQVGREVIDKLLFQELYGHAVGAKDEGEGEGGFYKPLLNLMGNFAPWSVPACLSLWRVWKQPARDMTERRFERFLCCALLVGLIIFSLSSHQRGRLVLPLIPFAALLAGRELARWVTHWPSSRLLKVSVGLAAVALGAIAWNEHVWQAKRGAVKETAGAKQLAELIQEKVGIEFPLTHVDTAGAFQIYLKAVHPMTTMERAQELLRGDAAVFVAVENAAALRKGVAASSLYELARWPASGKAFLSILGNRPELRWESVMACGIGTLDLRLEGVRLRRVRGREFVLEATPESGRCQFSNRSAKAQQVRVRLVGGGIETVHDHVLAAGESWEVTGHLGDNPDERQRPK